MLRKTLLSLGGLFILFLVAAVSLPFLFKDKILAAAKNAANDNLNATVDFSDVDLSLFRNFPKLSVGLTDLSMTGVGRFDGVRLLKTDRLDVAVDFWSAISGGDLTVRSLVLKNPDLQIFVTSDGLANYDITKPTEPTTSTFKAKLEKYAIQNGHILYDDRSVDLRADLAGVDHEGRGEFTETIFDLEMTTRVADFSAEMEGVKYLSKAQANWDATMGMNLAKMFFTFKDNSLKINDLALKLDGSVGLPNDVDMVLDLKWSAPSSSFKDILSIVPGAYSKDFSSVQASGKMAFSGFAKGIYNEKTYPAFAFETSVADGKFKYPTLPLGMSDIDFDLKINSPTSNLNQMTVDLPRFALKIGENPISGNFFLKTPMTDPAVKTEVKGTLNLADLAKAFPVEGVKSLAGIVRADLFVDAKSSDIETKNYEAVNMKGDFQMQNIAIDAVDQPSVKINEMGLKFTPQRVEVPLFDAKLGKSDLRASGAVDNVLAFFSPEKTMTGDLKMQSFLFDANEWMPKSEASATTKTPDESAQAASGKMFDQWDFRIDGDIRTLLYDTYKIEDLKTKGHFTPNKMEVENFGFRIGKSDLSGSAKIFNVWSYLFDNQQVRGDVFLNSSFFDMNQFMVEDPKAATKTATSTAAVEPFLIPENVSMTISTDMKKVLYDNLELDDLGGKIIVADRQAKLQDCSAKTLGGAMAITGGYDTRDAAKPKFDFDFALQNMGFRSAFEKFNAVKKLAPIAQFMDGKFNTTLSMKGLLGKDMMPDFSTLTASGFLETLNAIVQNWKPLNEIGQKLNVDYLKNLEIKNTKNWFEIADGKVNLKPFSFKMKDVDFKIGGSHGLTNDMNYDISTRLPRKLLEKNAVGAAANSGLNWISGEAKKLGLNVAQGEFVNVLFNLTGSLFSPKVSAKVLGTDGESTVQEEVKAIALEAAEKAKDSLRNVASKEFDKQKDKATKMAEKAADSVRNVAQRKADELAKKAADRAKEEAAKVLGDKVGTEVGKKVEEKVGTKATEVLGEKGKKEADKAKEKLEKWDPFKKKKDQ